MIPRVGSVGKSFKGAYAYYLHDKDKASTSERVAWTSTLNLSTDTPHFALHEMIDTAHHANDIKKAHSGKGHSQKVINSVYTYSLSWHESENPSQDDMIKEAISSLKALKLENRQVMVIAHNDEKYKHIHLMVNRVDPKTGLVDGKNTISNDQIKLSKWANNYELERGQNFCPQRRANLSRRIKGEFVKYADDGTHRTAKHEAKKPLKNNPKPAHPPAKDPDYAQLIALKQKAIKTRLDAQSRASGLKAQWRAFYAEAKADNIKQWHDNHQAENKLKKILHKEYQTYKKTIFDQKGLVSHPFNYKARQTEKRDKKGGMTHQPKLPKLLAEKKQKLIKAQQQQRAKIIAQVNKEFAPRFTQLKKAQDLKKVQEAQKTSGLQARFKATSQQPDKPSLTAQHKIATQSHQSQKQATANDNGQSQEKPRTRNRSKIRKPRKARTRTRSPQ